MYLLYGASLNLDVTISIINVDYDATPLSE